MSPAIGRIWLWRTESDQTGMNRTTSIDKIRIGLYEYLSKCNRHGTPTRNCLLVITNWQLRVVILAPILYSFWDTTNYRSKITIFLYTFSYNALRRPLSDLWKLKSFTDSEKESFLKPTAKISWSCYSLHRFDKIPARDGQTDEQTDGRLCHSNTGRVYSKLSWHQVHTRNLNKAHETRESL